MLELASKRFAWAADCVTATRPTRILMIDDNRDDMVLVRETLRRAAPGEFVVEAAETLEEGRARLQSGAFDVVLLDFALPDSFGIETYDELREHCDLPVVVMSGNTSDELAIQAVQRGAQDYLVKGTVSGDLLVRILRHAITRHQMAAQLQRSEERLRVLCEQLPAILWTTDADLRFTFCRGRGLAAMALAQDEVVGQSLVEFFGVDTQASQPITMHQRALEGEPRSAQLNWGGHWYEGHVEPLRNALGEIIGTIGVALDVTGERRLKKDVEAAHRIQEHLLPSRAPSFPGFDIAGACYPAEQCSGDFYDYIRLSPRRLAVVLADVSGHGFGPAILAATIRSYLRTAAVLGNQVHEMLALGNRLLVNDGDATPFASVFAACLYADSRSLQYTSAGHPGFLIRKDGQHCVLETESVPIGVRESEAFPLSRTIPMKRGDILLMASDGLFEARRNHDEFFGVDRALQIVREMADAPAAEIVQRLRDAAVAFSGSEHLEDDVTVVVVKAISRREAGGLKDTTKWIDRRGVRSVSETHFAE